MSDQALERKATSDHIDKIQVKVIIQTTRQLLTGTIHVRMNLREKDDINFAEQFIAVTGVEFPGMHAPQLDSIILNKNEIVWFAPTEGIAEEELIQLVLENFYSR